MATKMDRTARLMSNKTSPFRVQMIVFAHDRTKEGLRAKIAALKSSMNKLGGMQYYEPAWEAAALSYWNAGLPGWAWDRYDDYSHKIDDVNLANILPVSSTPKADLEEAEWLHDGDRGNLIGGRLFEGAPGNESPAHAMVFGSSGCRQKRAPPGHSHPDGTLLWVHGAHRQRAFLQVLLEDAFAGRAARGHPCQRHEHDQLSRHTRPAVVVGSARQRHWSDAAPDGSARRRGSQPLPAGVAHLWVATHLPGLSCEVGAQASGGDGNGRATRHGAGRLAAGTDDARRHVPGRLHRTPGLVEAAPGRGSSDAGGAGRGRRWRTTCASRKARATCAT